MLLSGRIAAKDDGFPNMTDVEPDLQGSKLRSIFIRSDEPISGCRENHPANKQGSRYEPAKFSDAFWNHQLQPLRETAPSLSRIGPAVHLLRCGGPPSPSVQCWMGLSALFAAAFQDLAIRSDGAGKVFLEFSKLPTSDLIGLGKQLGLKKFQCDAEVGTAG